jgi:hypothetical protein
MSSFRAKGTNFDGRQENQDFIDGKGAGADSVDEIRPDVRCRDRRRRGGGSEVVDGFVGI